MLLAQESLSAIRRLTDEHRPMTGKNPPDEDFRREWPQSYDVGYKVGKATFKFYTALNSLSGSDREDVQEAMKYAKSPELSIPRRYAHLFIKWGPDEEYYEEYCG